MLKDKKTWCLWSLLRPFIGLVSKSRGQNPKASLPLQDAPSLSPQTNNLSRVTGIHSFNHLFNQHWLHYLWVQSLAREEDIKINTTYSCQTAGSLVGRDKWNQVTTQGINGDLWAEPRGEWRKTSQWKQHLVHYIFSARKACLFCFGKCLLKKGRSFRQQQ